jgi:hypothetical protein
MYASLVLKVIRFQLCYAYMCAVLELRMSGVAYQCRKKFDYMYRNLKVSAGPCKRTYLNKCALG